jgi:hypothetical protein
LPAASFETPMMRPGIIRTRSSRTAMNAACGPPQPSGTPKRCAEPMAMSAPIAPADFTSIAASGSTPIDRRAPPACRAAASAEKSRSRPSVSGHCTCAPNTVDASNAAASATTTSMPIQVARVRMTAMTCGWTEASTRKRFEAWRDARRSTPSASAAAVASSSSDALAIGRPVRSTTICWKFSSDSRRPCATSAW